MGNTLWICVQIAISYVINSFTAINVKQHAPSLPSNEQKKPNNQIIEESPITIPEEKISFVDQQMDEQQTFLSFVSKCIDEIHALTQYKQKIIQYFNDNQIKLQQFININKETFLHELSDYCGDNDLLIVLYESIRFQLYKLWTSDNVAEWIVNLFKEIMSKDEQERIKNTVKEQKYTGEYIDDMDEDDIKGFGINDPKYIEIIIKQRNKLKIPEQKRQPVYEKPQPKHMFQLSEDTKVHNAMPSPMRKLEIVKKRKQRIALKAAIKSKNWNTKNIIEHIMKIDGLPPEYEKLLTNGLNNFNGYNISELQKKDIKKWGIKKMKHRNQIYEQIQKLEVQIVPPSTAKAKEIDLSNLKSDKERKRLETFHLKMYDTVELKGKTKGVILYFGEVLYPSGNKMYKFGIELIENKGKGGEHNGTFNGIEYFQLNNKNGIFVSSAQIIDKIS